MIETRLVANKLSRSERFRRLMTLEGISIAVMVFLWVLLGFVAAPSVVLWLLILVIGLLAVLFALDSGVAAIQILFSLTFLATTATISALVFTDSSINVGLVGASGSTYLCFELFRLHETHRRNARVSPTLLGSTLPFAMAVVAISFVLMFVLLRPEGELALSWGFLPLASLALFLGVAAVGMGAMYDRNRQSGARFDPVVRTPPAPRQVDPLVTQARRASGPAAGPTPPPPTGAPTGTRPTR